MKRAGIGMMLCGLALLASCSKEETNARTEDEGIIRLGVTKNVTSRGAIRSLTDLSAAGDRVGVYAVQTANTDGSISLGSGWGGTKVMQNVQTTSIESDGTLNWADTYKYPAKDEPAQNVKFCLYHPYAAEGSAGSGDYVAAPAGGSAPMLHFITDGTTDVMVTAPVLGSRIAPASEVNFRHVLTQLSFELIDDEGTFTYPITNIELKEVNTTGAMDIETGALSNWGTPGKLNLLNTSLTLSKGVAQTLDKVVMLQPEQTSFVVTVTYTNGATVNKEVTITPVGGTGRFEAGHSYLITLRFSGSVSIRMKATLTDWVSGGTGQGLVE